MFDNCDNEFDEQIRIAKAVEDMEEFDKLPFLHRVTYEGIKNYAKALLDKGEDVNQTTEKGRTPLFYALLGKDGPNPEMVQFLKNRGLF